MRCLHRPVRALAWRGPAACCVRREEARDMPPGFCPVFRAGGRGLRPQSSRRRSRVPGFPGRIMFGFATVFRGRTPGPPPENAFRVGRGAAATIGMAFVRSGRDGGGLTLSPCCFFWKGASQAAAGRVDFPKCRFRSGRGGQGRSCSDAGGESAFSVGDILPAMRPAGSGAGVCCRGARQRRQDGQRRACSRIGIAIRTSLPMDAAGIAGETRRREGPCGGERQPAARAGDRRLAPGARKTNTFRAGVPIHDMNQNGGVRAVMARFGGDSFRV